MISFKHIVLFVFVFSLKFVSAQTMHQNKNIEQFFNDQCVKNAPIGIYVSNYKTNQVLFEYNSEMCLTPASVLKLVTTAAATEILGIQHTFETKIWYSGTIINKTLHGDIIITGGGDPTLGSKYFETQPTQTDFLKTWANAVKQTGIDTITGNIIADPNFYSDHDVPKSWVWEDLGNYYGAAAQGINLYDNTFEITFKTPAGINKKTQIIQVSPPIPNLEIDNRVRTSSDKRDLAIVYGDPGTNIRTIKGTLPQNREAFSIKASIPNPALLLAYEFKQSLSAKQIDINGKALCLKTETDSAPKTFIHCHTSPTLKQIIKQTNFESINLFAESLCKHIGYSIKNTASTDKGTEAITEFWESKGIDPGTLLMADGSGLSRYNAITAKTLTQILNYMQNKSQYAQIFESSVPVVGINGTQKYYFQYSHLKGKALAKTGSMTNIRSLAGYMTTQNGTPVSFSIIVNNFNCGSFVMAAKMEKIIEAFYLDL